MFGINRPPEPAWLKKLLAQVARLETLMAAFPVVQCYAEGHVPFETEGHHDGTPVKDALHIVLAPKGGNEFVAAIFLCRRCQLAYWEEV